MPDVLIATLGESPVVVSTMWNKLRHGGHAPDLTTIQIIYPPGDVDVFVRFIEDGYMMLQEHLTEKGCTVQPVTLPFADATTYEHSMQFLRCLATLLDQHEADGNRVFLSLAGGRKHLSALMGILTPFYPCIEGLYHLHDTEEHRRRPRSIEELRRRPKEEQARRLFPRRERFEVIELWKPGQAAQADLRRWLQQSLPEGIKPEPIRMMPEADRFYGDIFLPGRSQPASPPMDAPEQQAIVLLATVGDSPMVVPQTIALLQAQGQTVQAVVLIYPELYVLARNGVTMIQQVCARRDIPVLATPVAIDDLDSTTTARRFVEALQQATDRARQDYADATPALLLAGGRKGMSVLSLLVAHAQQMQYVYHTTIKDPRREQQIEQDYERIITATVAEQESILFLVPYDLDDFALIPIPLLPIQQAV